MLKTCSIEDCDRPFYARTWCQLHYRRWRTHGNPLTVQDAHTNRTVYKDPVESFWSKVDKGDGCWLWTAGTIKGYGSLNLFIARNEGRQVYAHRFAYELLVGPIPEGLTIDHLCVNTLCVNPSHMELVTAAENSRRVGVRRTHCKNDHEFTPENTYVRRDGQGRMCKACSHARYLVRAEIP